MYKEISYDELYYLVNEKNEDAEGVLFHEVEKYLGWLAFAKGNDFLREEDVFSYGWQGYIEAFKVYDEKHATTFKSFLQHCVSRRLIDVQRRRNKNSLKAHMSSLLMSEDAVKYSVETAKLSQPDETHIRFREFWSKCTLEEQKIFYACLTGSTTKELAKAYQVKDHTMYRKIRKIHDLFRAEMVE